MPLLPAHYLTLKKSLIDHAGNLSASYHLVEDGEAFDVPQPPQSIAAPLAGSEAAVAFNGQNSFACLAKAPAASGLSFWACPESVDGAQVFVSRGINLGKETTDISIGHRDGRLRITFGSEVWRAADRHFEPGVWVHVALLLDGEAPQIFINGELLISSQVVRPRNSTIDVKALASGDGALLLAAEAAGNATPSSPTEAAAFGLRRFFDGSLDGLGVWTRDAAAEGLTAAAIRRLASSGPPDLEGLCAAPAPALPKADAPETGTRPESNGHSTPDLLPSPAATDPAEAKAENIREDTVAATGEAETADTGADEAADTHEVEAANTHEVEAADTHETEAADTHETEAADTHETEATDADEADAALDLGNMDADTDIGDDVPTFASTATPPEGPSDEVWNELKELVTSINQNEPSQGAVPLPADFETKADLAVPDLSAPLDPELCQLDAQPETDAPDQIEAESDATDAGPEPLVLEDSIAAQADNPEEDTAPPATMDAAAVEQPQHEAEAPETQEVADADAEDSAEAPADAVAQALPQTPEVAEACEPVGLLSTLAELERQPQATPESTAAEAASEPAENPEEAAEPVQEIAAQQEPAPTEVHGPPDVNFGSNAELASALAAECAKAGEPGANTPEPEKAYGLDIKTESPAEIKARAEAEQAAIDKAISEMLPKDGRANGQAPDEEDKLNQRLRDALTGDQPATKAGSRFRLFRTRGKRDSSLPDLRKIRPHFGQKTETPAKSETDGLPPIFSYKVSGAFADRVVDFGSPVRVKLVPDYGTTTPVPQPSAKAEPKRPTRRPARLPAIAYDDLLDDQADELLFR